MEGLSWWLSWKSVATPYWHVWEHLPYENAWSLLELSLAPVESLICSSSLLCEPNFIGGIPAVICTAVFHRELWLLFSMCFSCACAVQIRCLQQHCGVAQLCIRCNCSVWFVLLMGTIAETGCGTGAVLVPIVILECLYVASQLCNTVVVFILRQR